MSWNPVVNKFVEIKNAAINAGISLWDYNPEKETCLEYWVRLLDNTEYKEILVYLKLTEYEDLLLLKYADYNEIFTDESTFDYDTFWDAFDGLYRECRSLVINFKTCEPVLTPFRKFRNLNECAETSYEEVCRRISTASCVEFSNKLDGSMQSARFYNGKIVMSGSQALNPDCSWRLKDGLKRLTSNENYVRMLRANPGRTFVFEYIAAKDAHVVRYDFEGLFLVGMRDVATGIEASYAEILECAGRYGVLTTEVYDKTLDQVISELDDKTAAEAEGFVLNIDGFKVKIKYNDYVTMHRMFSSACSPRPIIESIAEGRFDDLIAKIPAGYRNLALSIAGIVFEYKARTEGEVEEAFDRAPKSDKKEFMLWVNANVPHRIQGYVRNRYLGFPVNVLKKSNSYLRLKEITDFNSSLGE